MSSVAAPRSVGVVVAFANRDPRSVFNLVRTLSAQTRRPEAVVVINFGARCPVLEEVSGHHRFLYRHLPQALPWSLALARNQGARLLPAVESVLFLDADLLLAPDFIGAGLPLLAPARFLKCRLSHLPRGAITPETDVVGDFPSLRKLAVPLPGPDPAGGCLWLRRKAFRVLRGHDEAFKMWCFADLDFQRRARWLGLRVVHLDEETGTAALHHWHRSKADAIKDPAEPQAHLAREWYRKNRAHLRTRAAAWDAGTYRLSHVNPHGWGSLVSTPATVGERPEHPTPDSVPAHGPGRHHGVLCADAPYVGYAGVTIYSLLVNNAEAMLAIVLITDEIDAADRRRIDELSRDFQVPLTIHLVTPEDRELLCDLRGTRRLPVATYYRWLIPRVLPAGVKTVLYLDSDVIVDGPIGSLLRSDMTGKAIGVAPDGVGGFIRRKTPYFNTGVMLINLAQWKALKISARATAYGVSHPELPFGDQDALNAVVPSRAILWLGAEYNCMLHDRLRPELREVAQCAAADAVAPIILHFPGETKPWHRWSAASRKDTYLEYLQKSPWRDAGLVKEHPVTERERKICARLPEKSGDAAHP